MNTPIPMEVGEFIGAAIAIFALGVWLGWLITTTLYDRWREK